MSTQNSSNSPAGKATADQPPADSERQPEALANFAATARAADGVSPTGGREATAETAPLPSDNERKADAATRVLREGTLGTDQGAEQAVDRLPDRTRSTGS